MVLRRVEQADVRAQRGATDLRALCVDEVDDLELVRGSRREGGLGDEQGSTGRKYRRCGPDVAG